MSKSFTQIADLVTHNEFGGYVAQAMVDRSTLLKSGIAVQDPAITELVMGAGTKGNFVNLPFFNALTKGEADPIKDDGTELSVQKITAGEDIAVIMRRGQAFGATDLAGMLAGADPMQAIANGLADWWNAEKQLRLVSVLNGLLCATGALSDHVVDLTGESSAADKALTPEAILDAAQVLGDHKGDIIAYAMNSATENFLMKLNTSNMYRPSDTPARLATFNGRAVIVDDNLANGEIILFGAGAVAINPGRVENPIEKFREELKSQGGIVSRDTSIVHVRGCKWAVTTTNPNNAALATATNYAKVYDHKLIRVAKLKAAIA